MKPKLFPRLIAGTCLALALFPAAADPRDRFVGDLHYRVTHDFTPESQQGSAGEGSPSGSPLVLAADGWLYGISSAPRSDDGVPNSYDWIWRAGPGQSFTIVKTPKKQEGSRLTGLTAGPDGALYGTAQKGGPKGQGALFRLTTEGRYEVVWAFDKEDSGIGGYPRTRLALAPDGQLYGTTGKGSENKGGAIYRFTPPRGPMTLVRPYSEARDARHAPYRNNNLFAAADGFLYQFDRSGQLFRISPSGSLQHLTTIDGAQGNDLIEDVQGNLYGTSYAGGRFAHGMLFRIDRTTRAATVLHDFGDPAAGAAEGIHPVGVMLAADGSLRGSCQGGGTRDGGTLWRIATDGSGYREMVRLLGAPQPDGSANGDGAHPAAAPALASDGHLIGAASGGGLNFSGTLYSLDAR